MKILVTGGAGFIGSAVVRLAVGRGHAVVNLDALTYAADLRNVAEVAASPALRLREGGHPRPRERSTASSRATRPTRCCTSPPRAMSTARSTAPAPSSRPTSAAPARCSRRRGRTGRAGGGPRASASTTSRPTRSSARSGRRAGSPRRRPTTRARPTRPRRRPPTTWCAPGHETYGLPVLVTNCSNNYGPYHFPEKLIPVVILNALARPAYPGLRRGRERARLALRRGPRRRAAAGARAGPGRADLQHRRRERDAEHRPRAHHLPAARRAPPRGGAARAS